MFCLESGIQLKETGIPLTIEMRNPSSTDKESGMQYSLLSGAIVETLSSCLQKDTLGLLSVYGIT